ncbi:hypothetical protein GCM10017608_25800 [Agromyces luteolus]|uniref:hypothetical protein n=1 Tax=Agromyces luteolus TaxID=88373 RepID=UPI0022F2DDEC|nr:hypothetical protein [Agromyces luteolus]GLK28645.1 hypothetical protein GCM10017608_25800 [Agromyces luteolus]
MAGFWARRRRGAPELQAHDAELATRAGSALFAADERVRAAAEQLDFVEAELGPDATVQPAEVLAVARRQLGEAFRLNRHNHDPMPGAADEVRARYLRVIDLCETVLRVLDEQASDLGERMSRARRTPDLIARVRADLVRARARIPYVRATLDRLGARYARDALAGLDADPAEADRLLGFAAHSLGVAERRRSDGESAHADVALEASARSLRRAATLLDAVETFEVEALRAEAALPALADECRRELALALRASRSPDAAGAIAELQAALAVLPAAGVDTDPLGHLRRLRAAREGLDAAIAAARASASATSPESRPESSAGERPAAPPVVHVHHAVRDADRRLDVARDAVAGHPGWIGAEALARLAESERIRVDLGHYLGSASSEVTVVVTDLRHREHVIELARRAASLASESLSLARRDIGAMRAQGLGA